MRGDYHGARHLHAVATHGQDCSTPIEELRDDVVDVAREIEARRRRGRIRAANGWRTIGFVLAIVGAGAHAWWAVGIGVGTAIIAGAVLERAIDGIQ